MLAALTAMFGVIAVSCEKPAALGDPNVEVKSATEITLAQEGGEADIQILSTLDWKLKDYTDEIKSWLVITPQEGKASNDVQTIHVKALANDGANRKATIQIYGNVLYNAAITVPQNGPKGETGGVEPVTVAEFIQKADKSKYYRLTGTVSGFNSQYCSFDLTDATGKIYVYSLTEASKTEWASKIANGGTVVLRGKYEYYAKKNQHEVIEAIIESYEGPTTPPVIVGTPAGTGVETDPYNVAKTLELAKGLTKITDPKAELNATNSVTGFFKGTITEVQDLNIEFGNATYLISDGGQTTATFLVYRGLSFNGEKFIAPGNIRKGDEVVVQGSLVNYNGTIELTQGSKLVTLNGGKTLHEGEVPEIKIEGNKVKIPVSVLAKTWAEENDATYGAGFSVTGADFKIGVYKHSSTSTIVKPSSEIRVYKNTVLKISAPEGKKIASIVMGSVITSTTDYCKNMTPLVGEGSVTANAETKTITWKPKEPASTIAAQADIAQTRVVSLEITLAE